MPLLKKTPFTLLEPPKDLELHELVYQICFTKEIFRDYQEYLGRINLYRQRTWTCKISGKTNLTFEEALVSEKVAARKNQAIPKELVAPALRIIQFSMLSLKDLADTIAAKLQDQILLGAELQGKRSGRVYPCRVLEVVAKEKVKSQYKVAWLDERKEVSKTALLNGDDLIRKKFPLSRDVFKSFIRESTYRSAPWVLHDSLAKKHKIPVDLPDQLKDKIYVHNGIVCNKKKRKTADNRNSNRVTEEESRMNKKKKQEDGQPKEEPIKYPIDDMLVQPGPDDPIFTERPLLSRDFNIPMCCVGDFLMIWDFCSSFSRLLRLWPFGLEDLENVFSHKHSNLSLMFETHSALLRLLIKDKGEYYLMIQKRNRKLKMTLSNWKDYVCDFLEMVNCSDFETIISPIRRGHYGLLDAEVKVAILRKLVDRALATDLIREQLDKHIEQRHVLEATRREIEMQEAKKKREEEGLQKAESISNRVMNGNASKSINQDVSHSIIEDDGDQNGDIPEENRENVSLVVASDDSRGNHSGFSHHQRNKKQNVAADDPRDSSKVVSRKETLRQLKEEKKEAAGKMNEEQRREYFEKEMEKLFIRTNSLGKDRHYSRYWWFQRNGRIFVESSDSEMWGYYGSKEELDALIGSLNPKGERENALRLQLQKLYSRISSELQKRSQDLAHGSASEEAVVRRSTRVRATLRESGSLGYVNKWKED